MPLTEVDTPLRELLIPLTDVETPLRELLIR